MTTVSLLDLGLGLLALLFLVRGLLRGMIQEVAGLIGIFLGLLLAGRFYPQLVPQFSGIIESQKVAGGVSYAIIFAAALMLVALCAALVKRFMAITFTAWVDNLAGAVVGAAKGVFVCSIVLALMQRFVPDSPFLKASMLHKHMDALVAFARSFLPSFIQGSLS